MNWREPSLRPIPTPFRNRWREFRIARLPALAFGVVVITAAVLWWRVVPVQFQPGCGPCRAHSAKGTNGAAQPAFGHGATQAAGHPTHAVDQAD